MNYNYKTLGQIGNVKGKRVLLRIDTNVAIADGRVIEDFRLKKIFPTLGMLKEGGAKIILIGHLESTETTSLLPVYTYLKNYFPVQFVQSPKVVDQSVTQAVAGMQDGDIILLENLRLNDGEKTNSPEFAGELAALADIYIDEAFSVAHRKHASIVGVPTLLPSFAGLLFDEEVKRLSECFDPPKPFTFILGGAKFETKLPLVQKFLAIADHVYIAGALANDCYKQKGLNIGESVVSEKPFDLKAIIENPKTMLPSDVVVKDMNTEDDPADPMANVSIKLPTEVLANDKILDAGTQSLEDLRKLIGQSKFVLWNGPLGNYENGFTEPTEELAKMIAEGKDRGLISVLGGGDTLTVISDLKIEDKFSFVSSAGGAMLDFLANETLPGIEALVK